MIISPRLTERFTVLPNELLNDRELSLDAIAAMGRLLALPHDWTVCLQDLRRRWGCGLERLKRIMRELIAAGWVQRLPPRKLPNGAFSRGDYKVFNVRQEVQDDLPFDATANVDDEDGAALTKPATPAESAEPESGEPESVGRTPNKGRTSPRTDSPKQNPPREIPPAPSPPASADAATAPKGAPSPRAVLCPDGFAPEGRHYAAAEALGFDAAFVRQTAASMRRWSHANAHRPIARKADWALAFDAFLDTALREAAERAAREVRRAASRPTSPHRSTNGGLALVAEMIGLPHDPADLLNVLGLQSGRDGGARDAGVGSVHRPVHEPVGGCAGLLPPQAPACRFGA